MLGLSRTTGGNGAEIILMMIDTDRTHADPDKDLRCWKQGDVESVLPGSAHDGNLVTNPIVAPWWMLRVVGVPQAIARKYEGSVTTSTPDPQDPNVVKHTMTRRRLFGVVFSSLPAAIQTALTSQRYAVIQWSTLRLAMRNKVTGNTEP